MKIKRVVVKPYSHYQFELVTPFFYEAVALEQKYTINIPSGFTTNGADIPRIFWIIYPPYKSEYLTAVVVLDYLCNEANNKLLTKQYKEASKAYLVADLIFKKIMKDLQVSKTTTCIFYRACRLYHILRIYLRKIIKA